MMCGLQTLEKKKKSLLGGKLPFVRSKYLGWGEDTLSSEDGSLNSGITTLYSGVT